MEIKELAEYSPVPLSEQMLVQLERDCELLLEWNEKINLTALRTRDDIYEKHFLDCLLPIALIGQNASVIDVGSGAGFPGVVFAIARPDLRVTLLEPIGKRVRYLQLLVSELKLNNVTVIQGRAEDVVKSERETFDVAVARAVAGLPVLSELCAPFIRVGGMFLAMKGPQGSEEVKAAEHAFKVLGLNAAEIHAAALPGGEIRNNISAMKVSHTPAQYPRNYGQIKKKPL